MEGLGGGGNASALDICTHPPPCPFSAGNLSLPRAGEETSSMAGRRLPETGDGRSAISADRACVSRAHACVHVGGAIKAVRSHYSRWRRGGEDSLQGCVYTVYAKMTQKSKILYGFNNDTHIQLHTCLTALLEMLKIEFLQSILDTNCYPEQLKNSTNNVQYALPEFVIDLGLVDFRTVHRLIALICTQMSLCYSAILGEFRKDTHHREVRSHQHDAGTTLTLLNGAVDS